MSPEAWFVNLGIQISKLNRVAFTIFNIDIYWYGIIIGIAVISGVLFVIREAKRTGQEPDVYSDFAFFAIILCIIGARLYYVIFSWDYYRLNPAKILALREGGLAIYGAIITGIISAAVYCRVKKLSFLRFGDTAVFGLLLGQIIGRWGNFINREAFGKYTDSLFALRYLRNQVLDVPASVLEKAVTYNGFSYIQVHPTFLYESFWNLCLFIFLNLYKDKKKFDGEIFTLYVLWYGLGRFWIEGLRTDQLIIGNTGIPVSQALSLVLALAALGFMLKKRLPALSLIKKKD